MASEREIAFSKYWEGKQGRELTLDVVRDAYLAGWSDRPYLPAPQPNMTGVPLTEWEINRLSMEASAKAAVYSGHAAMGTRFRDNEKADMDRWHALAEKLSKATATPSPRANVVGMVDEDRTPVPQGFDAAQWRKADEVHHAMALVADDTECVKILYATLAATEGSAE